MITIRQFAERTQANTSCNLNRSLLNYTPSKWGSYFPNQTVSTVINTPMSGATASDTFEPNQPDSTPYVRWTPTVYSKPPRLSSCILDPLDPSNLRIFERPIRCLLSHREALRYVEIIGSIGLLPPAFFSDVNSQITSEQMFEMVRTSVHGAFKEGNMEDLKSTIILDRSPKSEAAAHWCTYKQPEAVIQWVSDNTFHQVIANIAEINQILIEETVSWR